MPLRVVFPANLLAFAALIAREAQEAGLDPLAIARAQGVAGKSCGFVDEFGDTLAVACFISTGPRDCEAVFAASPRLAPRLFDWVKLAQLTLPGMAENRLVMIRTRTKAGARLGRALGFRPDAERPELMFWRRT
jgi:hypothetical protein